MEKTIMAFKSQNNLIKGTTSQKIPPSLAKSMRDAYLESSNQNKVYVNNAGSEQVLEAIKLDAADALDLLRPSVDSEGNIVSNVSEIIALFGLNSSGSVTLTFASVVNNNGTSRILADKMYDLCDPCPSKCPTNINTFDTE